jgi:hypothetical protein
VTLLVVLVAASGGAVAWARHETASPPQVVRPTPSATSVVPGRPVHLDEVDHTMTFLPVPRVPHGSGTVSAQHAYDALVDEPTKLNPIPATVNAYYGLLTDPSTTPVAAGLPVWGFAVEAGCVYSFGPPASTRPTRPPLAQRCRHWEFVDARTGRNLGVVEQEVLRE